MFKAIIIDDEEGARMTLQALLSNYVPEIELLASCSNVPDWCFRPSINTIPMWCF